MSDSTLNESTAQALLSPVTTVIDAIDGDLALLAWSANNHDETRHTYAVRTEDKKAVFLHCVIMERILGRSLEKHELVDHRNGDQLRNTRDNLRLANTIQNGQNRKLNKNSTSGYKGVSLDSRREKWCAAIRVNRKNIHLGYFDTPEQAARAYDAAALENFGEYARPNFESDTNIPQNNDDVIFIPLSTHQKGSEASALLAEALRTRPIQSNNTSGYKGVRRASNSQKWVASIRVNRKGIHLGCFSDIRDAIRAYNAAALEHFGESAYLNPLPDETAPLSGGEQ